MTERMTTFEKARVLGLRATQIAGGSPVHIDTKGETDPLRIARMELISNDNKMLVKRDMPDGTVKRIPVNDMIIN